METTDRQVVVERPVHSPVAAKIAQIIWLIVTVIVILLAIRIVFALIGANLANPFANFIYAVTEPFVWPFRGLLQVGEMQYGIARFEFESMVAMFVYLLIGWGLTALIRTLSRPAAV